MCGIQTIAKSNKTLVNKVKTFSSRASTMTMTTEYLARVK